MGALAKETCQPCRAGTPPLSPADAKALAAQVPAWTLADKSLTREFVMKDFSAAVAFLSEIAKVADAQDHHPDVHLTGYRKLRLELSTHSIGGLSRNDFILAARIDGLPREEKRI